MTADGPEVREQDEQIARRAAREWLKNDGHLTPLTAMNSSTWRVDHPGGRHVLKITGASGEPGLRIASWLEDRGVVAGAPARMATIDGRLVALLRFVDGRALDPDEVGTIGRTLGEIHLALVGAPVPAGLHRWPWNWLNVDAIDEGRLRDAARAAVERGLELAPGLTHGLLHGDPAPEAFLETPRGPIALIDWGSALHGPLLYDLASAWLYGAEDPDLIEAYAQAGPLDRAELEHVRDFLAYRWAVQAWYFAQRLAAGDLTGIESRADNEKGLADARRALLGIG